MEKAVAEHLGKEHLNAALCKNTQVGILLYQRFDIRNRDAVDALHDQHVFSAVITVNIGHV